MTAAPKINSTATAPSIDASAQTSDSCCLIKLKNKVCEIVQSRWTIVAVMGLAIGAVSGIALGAAALGVGALGAWYFSAADEVFSALRCYTINTLGVFSDFVEFLGDYGPTLNPIKERLEACLLGQVAGKQTGEAGKPVATAEDIQADCDRGGTFGQVLPLALLEDVIQMAEARGLPRAEFAPLLNLIRKHHSETSFHALQNCSTDALTGVDNDYRKKAKAEGKLYDLPTPNSPAPIIGETHAERVLHLADGIFTPEMINCIILDDVKGADGNVKDGIHSKFVKESQKFPDEYRTDKGVIPIAEIEAFTQTKLTAASYHFLYECSRLYEMSQDKEPVTIEIEGKGRTSTPKSFNNLFEALNYGKELFSHGLGSAEGRAAIFRRHLENKNGDVIFLQEAERHVSEAIDSLGYYSTRKAVKSRDGSEIHLKKTTFKPQVEIFPPNDDDKQDQKSLIIKATQIKRDIPTVLTSIHGDAKNLDRTKTLCTRAINIFINCLGIDPRTQFYAGIDANPANAKQMTDLKAYLRSQGFELTDFGINMIKGRAISTQVRKRLDLVQMQKDGFIVPIGYRVSEASIAFESPPLNPKRRLPDGPNPSDHGAVGALIQPVLVKV